MSEETIFSEVDEELRSERMRNLWRRFAPYVFGAAFAIVLLVAANEGWSWWNESNAARSSDQFYTALDLADEGDVSGAQDALNTLITEGSGEYPILAKFRQAALLIEDSKPEEAVAAYDALATSLSNQRLRDLALVFAAGALVDSGDVAAVNARIVGLIAPDNSLRNTAREALGLTQYAAGELDAARVTFEQILADPTGGADALGRVQIYVSQLISEGAVDPNAAPVVADTETPVE